jgi:predicted exporter
VTAGSRRPWTAGSRRALALTLVAALALLGATLLLVPIRTDVTDLLPGGRGAAARLLMQQVRGGAAELVLIGIEGAPEAQLAALSQTFAAAVVKDPNVALVENGHDLLPQAQIDALFARRYLLSPAISADRFTAAALHADFGKLVDALQSSASPLVEKYGLADPTGAFPALLDAWRSDSTVRIAHGVWFAGGSAPRALLLLRLRPGGDGVAELRRQFEALPDRGNAQLLLAGPAVFTAEATAAIAADARLLSIFSTIAVALLLLWRFRSPWVLAAIAIPPLFGVSAGMLAVALRFGFVHGVTLGFGMTMLGVTVDYPVLLVGHRKQQETEAGTLRRIGATFALSVFTASVGLAPMVFAGMPGVAQLGLFAVAGLLTAAAATRWLLPRLIVAANLAPVAFGDTALLHRVEPWRRARLGCTALVAAACVFLLVRGGPDWQQDLSALAPIPPASLALDATLRRDLGAPEPGELAVVTGDSAEQVLQREEVLMPALDGLVHDGVARDVAVAARLLPSQARQRANRAALPTAPALAAAVAQAQAGLPFTDVAFNSFQNAVAAARTMAPLGVADLKQAGLDSPALIARLGALLTRNGPGSWLGVVAPLGLRDASRFGALFQGRPNTVFIDIPQEMDALATGTMRAATRLLLVGLGICALALAVALRDAWHVARVILPIASALALTVATLTALGEKLALPQLLALPFVAGVGLDYALFFARRRIDAEERARTLRTLLTCMATALVTFGLLAFCRTPLLRGIGGTVAIGVVAAMLCAFFFAGSSAGSEERAA